MIEEEPRQSLADDPDFQASLSDLDRGLSAEPPVRPESPTRPVTPLQPVGRAAAPPIPSHQPSPRPAPAAVPLPSAPSPSGHTQRPLIELFPQLDTIRPPSAPDRPPIVPASGAARASTPPPMPAAAAAALTYESFYGLNEPPFSPDPDLKFLYQSRALDRASQEMLSAIRRRDGIVLLTGRPGVGKTMLCRSVLEQLDRRTLTSFVSEPFTSADELLKTVLLDFGVISRADAHAARLARGSRAELLAALRDFLSSLAPLQAFAVVIVDDAQQLSQEALEHVRDLLDVEGDERLLQIVLVGNPSLHRALHKPELRPLTDRVSVRCVLGPLDADEVGGYIRARLQAAGPHPRVEFDATALATIARLSGGVPRIVNLLCDRALADGFASSTSVIDDAAIERAAEELDLAPPRARTGVLRRIGLTIAFLALMLVGAAAAAFVFRPQIDAALAAWTGRPQPSPAPRLPAAEPYRPPVP